MADSKESQAVEQPAFDPTKLLGQLEQVIKNNSTATTAGSKSNSPWGTVIILAVVLIGIAAWSWVSWLRGRELAKLRHEKERARIIAEQAKIDTRIMKNDEIIAKAAAQAKAAIEARRLIEADIRAEEARYEADRGAITRIRTWDSSYRRAS